MNKPQRLKHIWLLVSLAITLAGCASATKPLAEANQTVLPEDVYHHHSDYSETEGAKNIQVEDSGDGSYQIKALGNDSHLPAKMSLDGKVSGFYPAALGSENIKIVINKKVGYTEIAGLKFRQEATMNIWKDGTVELDREGVEAADKNNISWISKRVTSGGKNAIVIVRKR